MTRSSPASRSTSSPRELPDIGRDYNGFNLVYEPGRQDADPRASSSAILTDVGVVGEYAGGTAAGLRGVPDVRPLPVRQERARARADLHGRQAGAAADGAHRVCAGRHRPVGPRRQVLRHAGPPTARRLQGAPAVLRQHLPRRPPTGRPVQPGGVRRLRRAVPRAGLPGVQDPRLGSGARSARRSPTSTPSASGSARRWT